MCDYIVCKRANQGNPLHTAPLKTPSISRGSWALGRYILAVPMRKVTEVSLDVRQADHPKKACELMASRRFGRYLTMDARGRLRINATKVAAEAKDDGTCVVTTNDDTLDAEDVALGYTSLRLIEGCFRRMKTTGLQTRPIDHGRPHRIIAHVKLCVLALLLERAAEIRGQQTWRTIRQTLDQLKVVRYRMHGKTILQSTQVTATMVETLRSLGIPLPKKMLDVSDEAYTSRLS